MYTHLSRLSFHNAVFSMTKICVICLFKKNFKAKCRLIQKNLEASEGCFPNREIWGERCKKRHFSKDQRTMEPIRHHICWKELHFWYAKQSCIVYMCPLVLKLSSVLKLLILTAKLLVNIKTQDFYSCLILTENLVVSIKSFHPLKSFKTNHSSS